ncbi:MAG: GntR family transcriptional regulator [Acidobacteriaceae bacterium]
MSRTALSSPVPLYFQIAEVLRERIVRGMWRKGELIPTLEQLAAEFEVARVTARQAVQLLMSEGTLTPQRGRGTFVSANARLIKPVHVVTSLEALADIYRATTPKLLTIDEHKGTPPIRGSDELLAPGYTHMKRVHSIDDTPYCVISLYLDERIFSRAPHNFRTRTVIPILMQMKPKRIARAQQTLTIGVARADVAHLLRIPVDAPVAHVQRIFYDAANVVIYYAEVTYRGDAIKLEMDMAV